MNIPITQSDSWAKMQDDLGIKTYTKTGKDYHYLAILKNTPVGNYLYCPYGPVSTDQIAFKKAIDELKSLGREQKAIFIRIEPQNIEYIESMPKQAKKSKDISPKDTWLLDLSVDKPQLLTNFSQGTRTRYNTYQKKGLVVETTEKPDEIEHLVELQNKLYKAKNLNAFSADYLRTELKQPFATLYLVKYDSSKDQTRKNAQQDENAKKTKYPLDNQVLAASLFFDYQKTRYYMQSAADTEFKRLPATVALLTSAIFDAKEKGITSFDFWGIAPDGAPADHPWAGFTEFKKSFGGYPCHYAGTYDIVLSPTKYRLYRSTRQLGRVLHK